MSNLLHSDSALLEKITKSLGITIPPYILRSRDPRNLLTAIFSSWLPLSTAVLVSVVEYLPNPKDAQALRLPDMIDDSPGAKHVDPVIRDVMVSFKTGNDDPVVAYVSKMVSIPESELPSKSRRPTGGTLTAGEARDLARRKREELAKLQVGSNENQFDSFARITDSMANSHLADSMANSHLESPEQSPEEEQAETEHLIGFARLYSGTLSVGDSIYVLAPKFNPARPHAPEPEKVTVTGLYLLMGRTLENLESVPAGVVVGIAGLEGHIMKTGTLCSQIEGSVNLAGISLSNPPIVRVALEPVNPSDLNKMINGLKMLERSDPCAQYEVLSSGEHVIVTAGELHLERCIKDLRERFARCEIQAGEAIVPYRETILSLPDMAPPKNPDLPRGTVLTTSSSKHLTIRLRVRPLPAEVTEFLSKNRGTMKEIYAQRRGKHAEGHEAHEDDHTGAGEGDQDEAGEDRHTLSIDDFKKQLNKAFDDAKDDKEAWAGTVEKITEFGPKRVGPNLLIDATPTSHYSKL